MQGSTLDDFASSVLGLAFILKLPSARLDVGTPLLSPEDGGLPLSHGIEKLQNTKGDNLNRNRNGYGHFASFVQSLILIKFICKSTASNRGLKSAEWGNPHSPFDGSCPHASRPASDRLAASCQLPSIHTPGSVPPRHMPERRPRGLEPLAFQNARRL